MMLALPIAALAFRDVPLDYRIMSLPGLMHYYPLRSDTTTRDVVGGMKGKNFGVIFDDRGAVFNGSAYIEIPDGPNFSVDTYGQLTVIVFVSISDWRGSGGNGEYINWMGKGAPGHYEWTFRHYVKGGTGQAVERPGRVSVYHFNADGGLGSGAYVEDAPSNDEFVIIAQFNTQTVEIWKSGELRMSSTLDSFDVTPENLSAPVRIGSRDDDSGYFVGRMRNVAFLNRNLSSSEIQHLLS